MADTDRIKRNLAKMIDQGAPESDIDGYLKTEGFNSADEWRAALKPGGEQPKPVGAAMAVQQPRSEIGPGPRTSHFPTQGRSWADVPADAGSNFFKSAGEFAHNVVQPFLSPIETGKNILALGGGVVSKLTPPEATFTPSGRGRPKINIVPETPEQKARRAEVEAPADAAINFLIDRYGSEEGLKNTLATDPVGFLADAATVLTGGGALAARAPGVVGKVGAVAGKAGAVIDPLSAAGSVLKGTVKLTEPAVSNVLGMTTGAGAESIRAAGRAGLEGGDAARAFTQNMRGNVPTENIVELARAGLEKIRQERADAYKAGKADLSKDKTVLDFNDIDGRVTKASEVGTYKGQTTEPKAVAITQEMNDSISAWKQLDPAEFHTPEGLDALKRRLGNIRDATQPNTPERVAADRIYSAVRDEVAKQAPGYAKMMEDYAVASDKLKEVGKTFSLGEKATGETAARKLQAATRDGAQTSWRKRGELLNELAKYEPDLPYAIAGQSMNALAPRGLVARGGGMVAAGSGLTLNPLVATLPAFSPRLVGEGAYLGGRAVNALSVDPALARAVGQGAFQAGRLDDMRTRALALRSHNALRQ